MKLACITLALMTFATAALAEEQKPPTPDYSRPTLFRIFAEDEQPPRPESRVQWHAGWVDFKALGTRWRFSPFFGMIPGSYPTTRGMEMPDPFLLTNTQIAYRPGTYENQREKSRELRRIERLEKQRAKLRVKAE